MNVMRARASHLLVQMCCEQATVRVRAPVVYGRLLYGPSNRHVYSRQQALNVRISRTRCAQFAIPVDECGWQMRIIIACEYKARIGTRFKIWCASLRIQNVHIASSLNP